MVLRTAADPAPSQQAIEFVRFCYRRRRVGWPELYDEMCAVAGRGLYQGWGTDELSAEGIGFGLFELPALAALVSRVIAEECERRDRETQPAPTRIHVIRPEEAPAEEDRAAPVRLMSATA